MGKRPPPFRILFPVREATVTISDFAHHAITIGHILNHCNKGFETTHTNNIKVVLFVSIGLIIVQKETYCDVLGPV